MTILGKWYVCVWNRRLNRSRIVQSDPARFLPLNSASSRRSRLRLQNCRNVRACVRVCFNGSQTSFACSAENSSRGRSEWASSTAKLDPWQMNFFCNDLTLRRWLQNIDKYFAKCCRSRQQRVAENFYLPTNDDRYREFKWPQIRQVSNLFGITDGFFRFLILFTLCSFTYELF